jgi:hypothetical protein
MVLSEYSVAVMAEALLPLFDGGRLCVYGGKVVLAEFALPSPAFVDGSRMGTIAPCLKGRKGRAERFVVYTRGGEEIGTGTVGVEGADLNLNDVDIEDGGAVTIKSFALRVVR